MGIRSFNKYFMILNLAMAFAKNVLAWHEESTNEDSEGGDDITASEWVGLADVIAKSIMDASGVMVDVSVNPKE